jgi:SAM-dependent methyltransferase
MKANHDYVLKKCDDLVSRDATILDYGCGKGVIVEEGIRRGFDFYGVEAFAYGSGTNIKDVVENNDLIRGRVRHINIEDNLIPFPDNHFDLVVSNQVFEHVVDMDKTLGEINRVTKNDGKILLIFPSMESWREGHCGVYFAHWLPKSRLRYYWLLLNRTLGIGRLKRGRSRRQWAEFFNEWLVGSVTYRSIEEIDTTIKSYFSKLNYIEDDYLSFRLSKIKFNKVAKIAMTKPISKLSKFFVRKRGSLVIVAHNI